MREASASRYVLILVALGGACTAQVSDDDVVPDDPKGNGGARMMDARGGLASPAGAETSTAPSPIETRGNFDASAASPDSATSPQTSIDAGSALFNPAPGVLPVLWIEVPGKTPETLPSPNDNKVTGSLKIIDDHDGTHNGIATRPAALATPIGITLRGSSSASFSQRSFSIEVRDNAGLEKKVPVLGMPAEADWAAVACWTDKTCMRNALAYSIGQRLGRWSPRIRFVELFFNAKYLGLYQLVEPPRQDKNRVAIPKPAPDMTSGDGLTGGYIIRREASGKGVSKVRTMSFPRDWLSKVTAPGLYPHQIYYTYHYPKEQDLTAAQRTYIEGYIGAFETMMKADDFAGKYAPWIDVTSWADFTIMNELSNNVDGYWKSFYVTKYPDVAGVKGKLQATPLWDFNIAFGNADYRNAWVTNASNFDGLSTFGGECAGPVAQSQPLCDGICCQADKIKNTCKTKCWNMPMIPFYWERLRKEAAFQNVMKCRWKDLRRAGQALDMAVLDSLIAEWKAQLEKQAIPRHLAKWPELRKYVWPNPYGKDPTSAPVDGATVQQFFDKEVKWMRDWTDRRIKWLDANLPGTCAL